MATTRRSSRRLVEETPATTDAHEADSSARDDGAPRRGIMSLRTLQIDADTVEYRVCRSTRDALTSSAAPIWLLLAACLTLVAISLAEGDVSSLLLTLIHGGSFGIEWLNSIVAWLALAAASSLALALASAASAVVSESVLVMRDVGVQLSVRTMTSRSPRSVRFIDVETIAHVVLNEAVTTSDVFHYLCFVTRRGGIGARSGEGRGSRKKEVGGSKPGAGQRRGGARVSRRSTRRSR
jgi:hypothetical protein